MILSHLRQNISEIFIQNREKFLGKPELPIKGFSKLPIALGKIADFREH